MRPSRALFGAQTRLLRDFIGDSLYNLQHGYFSKQAPVGFLNPPIDFSTLPNRAAYLAHVQHQYTALKVAWLTPVEIFSPYYGAAIANYLTKQHISNTTTSGITSTVHSNNHTSKFKDGATVPLVVYEIGGGTGTLAKDILNWLKEYRPEVHATCRYTCIEISPTLAELQYQRVVVEQQGIHKNQFHVIRGDASEIATWQSCQEVGGGEDEACFVVAMEVLDNLPHDKVVYSLENNEAAQFLETVIAETDNNNLNDNNLNDNNHNNSLLFEENYQPVSDTLIHRCLQTWLDMEDATTSLTNKNKGFLQKIIDTAAAVIDPGSGNSSIFLPTRALQLFDTLHTVRSNHRMLAADFDFLPETVIRGENAPLVATTIDGVTKDHGNYLIQPGVADIFFPSDFELLSRLYDHSRSRCGGGRGTINKAAATAKHVKSKEFFEEWAEKEMVDGETVDGQKRARLCQDGYDPLIEDYSNTSFLVS